MKMITVTLVTSLALIAFAKEKDKEVKAIDWTLCQKEVKSYCSAKKTDHEKHECIEDLPEKKVSKECKEHNEKLEAQMGNEHKHDEKK